MPSKKRKLKAVSEISYVNIMEAARVCGDTSVLEKLFPEVFATPLGKILIKKKKLVAKKDPKKKADKMRVILDLDKVEAEVICTLLRHVSGDPRGPRGVAQQLAHKFEAQRIHFYEKCFAKDLHEISFVDEWAKMGKAVLR